MPDASTDQTGQLMKLVQLFSKMVTPKSSTATTPVPGLMDAKVKANEIPTESSGNLPPGLINQLMKDPRFLQYLNSMQAKSGMAQQQYMIPSAQPEIKTDLKPIGPAKQATPSGDIDPAKQQEILQQQQRLKALLGASQGAASQ